MVNDLLKTNVTDVPSSLPLPPYFFPLTHFAPHSTIRTPGTGYQFVFLEVSLEAASFDDDKEFKQDFNSHSNFEPSYMDSQNSCCPF